MYVIISHVQSVVQEDTDIGVSMYAWIGFRNAKSSYLECFSFDKYQTQFNLKFIFITTVYGAL